MANKKKPSSLPRPQIQARVEMQARRVLWCVKLIFLTREDNIFLPFCVGTRVLQITNKETFVRNNKKKLEYSTQHTHREAAVFIAARHIMRRETVALISLLCCQFTRTRVWWVLCCSCVLCEQRVAHGTEQTEQLRAHKSFHTWILGRI